MEKHIKQLTIKNFKSIRQVKMDCSRINLIVGQPNVGKSNLLEALALFSVKNSKDNSNFLGDLIRYNDFSELFFDQDLSKEISVNTDKGVLSLSNNEDNFLLTYGESLTLIEKYRKKSHQNFPPHNIPKIHQFPINMEGHKGKIPTNHPYDSVIPFSISKYIFQQPTFSKGLNGKVLSPPYGENLFSVILSNANLRNEIAEWFKIYRLDFVLDKRTKSLSVQKREGNIVYPISYNLIADTLQRIIFHYAAIESNKDSILLFEEPESHSFPPYITQLAHKIMEGDNNNQYFITTHSPFLFNTIVENTDFEDLSVFIASYKDYQTHLKKLSKADLSELLNNGIDIFFNQAYFLNE